MQMKPFKAIRPEPRFAGVCSALPYDVMSGDEARKIADGNPYTFLRVDRGEINLSGVAFDDKRAYEEARNRLAELLKEGVYGEDNKPKFYVYRLVWKGRAQTGVVGCASVDDYLSGKIKKHELTRADKEEDRVRHITALNAHTGPIFLAYKDDETLKGLILDAVKEAPLYDFTAEDGVRHTVWAVESAEANENIQGAFAKIPTLYIADGHHRAASAVRVALQKRRENPAHNGTEEFNYFLSVAFPASDLQILPYNRLLKGLNGLSQEAFLRQVEKRLGKVEPYEGEGAYSPTEAHTAGLYLNGKWYVVRFHKRLCTAENPVGRLDCDILQKNLLAPVLGIDDPRTDGRIDFAGGIRGLSYLEKRCAEDCAAAFALYPTSLNELFEVADAGEIMPPKSTWFEPKLRSGLLLHKM